MVVRVLKGGEGGVNRGRGVFRKKRGVWEGVRGSIGGEGWGVVEG